MKKLFLYTGESADGHDYHILDSLEQNSGLSMYEDELDSMRKYNSKTFNRNLSNCKIGGIYEFDVTEHEGGRITVSCPKRSSVVAYWSNMSDKIRWKAEDRAIKLSKQEFRFESEVSMRTLLEPLRIAYGSLSRDKQALLIAEIINNVVK